MADTDDLITFRAPKGWKAKLEKIADDTPGRPTPSVIIREALEARHPVLRKVGRQ
jgi:hypothetical protein